MADMIKLRSFRLMRGGGLNKKTARGLAVS
jgi:hypothetical protein